VTSSSSDVLVLASASARRREMLERVGLRLEVHPADVDESERGGEPPAAYVARIARDKAHAVARRGRWVLAADTTVTIDGTILAKADTADDAAGMLRRLSGNTHQVLTAFVLIGDRDARTVVREGLVSTAVSFVDLDDDILAGYIASGEWRGKAGAYAIQGIGAALVREVRGSVTNVIGLPLVEVLAALREVGGPRPDLAAGNPS
jgi:septum formation protein